jgi:hypothetical protein
MYIMYCFSKKVEDIKYAQYMLITILTIKIIKNASSIVIAQ